MASAQSAFDVDLDLFPQIITAHLVPNFRNAEETIDEAVRVLVEFDEVLDDLIGTGFTEEPQIICSEFLDFFVDESKDGDGNQVADLDLRENCRFCLEETDDQRFAVLVIPSILNFEDRVFGSFNRNLQVDRSLPKFLQIKDIGSPIEIVALPDFELIEVVETRPNQFALVFDQSVQFVRGLGTVAEVKTFCFQVFEIKEEDESALSNCTFTFRDDTVFVDHTGSINEIVVFDTENPSFFSSDDKFGLKPITTTDATILPRPALVSNTHNIDGTVTMEFDRPVPGQDITRELCSSILEFRVFVEGEFSQELFSQRSDIFCSVTFDKVDQTKLLIGFTDVAPFFPSEIEGVEFFFEFVAVALDDGPVISDGLSVLENRNNVAFNANAEAYEAVVYQVIGPSLLSRCDNIFTIEASQIAGPIISTQLAFSEAASITPEIGTTLEFNDFCQIFTNTIICDTSSLEVEVVLDYEFIFDVEGIFTNAADTLFIQPIIETPPLTVTQDFGVQTVPITVAGVNLLETVQTDRGASLAFTAVLGDVFGCGGEDQTSQVTFSWQVEDEFGEILVTQFAKIFSLVGDELPVGLYSVSLTADASDVEGIAPNTIEFELNVNPVEVVLVSRFGNDQTVSTEEEFLTLDASRSCNPNEVNSDCQVGLGFVDVETLDGINDADEQLDTLGLAGLNLSWSCSNCDEELEAAIFEGVDISSPQIDIPLQNFNFSSEEVDISQLNFVFTVDDPNDDEFVPQTLEVNVDFVEPPVECFVPSIEISPVDAKVNSNGAVSVVANIVAPEVLTDVVRFQWIEEVVGGDPVFDAGSAALQRSSLFIPANTLSEGASYTYRVTATADCAFEDGVPVASGAAAVSFDVNQRPVGGVVFVNPQVGNTLDPFTITTSSWVDPDGDNPLKFAFEIIYLDDDELAAIDEFLAVQTTPLSQFSQSLSITTNLQVPPENKNTVIIAVARDAKGAVSRRLVSNANSDVVVNNAFEAAGDVQVDEIEQLIRDLENTGDKTQIPNLCSAITSSLNNIDESTIDEELSARLTEVRSICLDAVVQLVDLDNNDDVALDADVVNLVASSISSITEKAEEIDDDLLAEVDEQTQNLVTAMADQVANAQRGDADPGVAAIIPDSFRQNIADTVSNVLSASELLFGESPARRLRLRNKPGRRLQDGADICDVLGAARSNVESVGNLQTSVVVAGAPQVDVEADNVKFAALRENINEVGGALSSIISIPAAGSSNDIQLPAGLAAELESLNEGVAGDLNIFGAKYEVLIRCEEREVEEVDCGNLYEYDGPREGFEGNIVSLDFLPLQSENSSSLEVAEIDEPIVIFLDLPESVRGDTQDIEQECTEEVFSQNNASEIFENEVEIDEEIVCGFFDEAAQDFITEFCFFTGLESVNGVLKARCECFHATDYAAWNAFKYDVKQTLKAQIVLTPLVRLILFVILPIILVLFMILVVWAYIRDKRDAKNILKGALARIKLMRILKARQKRRFFDNIKTAQVETIMKVHDNEMDHSAKLLSSTVAGVKKEVKAAKKHRLYLFRQFYLAIKYEHSLFGLSRYDPNFSRLQRSFVFIAVVISSFGASAILFELRSDVYAITVGVTVGVSLVAAVMVAIPIKFLGRALFKTTENAAGSQQDQVNNMYKIITRVELADGVESETDEQLVEAIHSFYVAEAKFARVSGGQGISRQNTSGDVKESVEVVEAVEVEYDEAEHLAVAEEYEEAKKALSTATYSARDIWREAKADSALSGKFYSSWSKIKSVRGQSSSALKVATLFSGEPSKQARARESRLPLWVLYLDWIFLSCVVAFYSFYTVAFIGTRSTRAEEGFEGHLDADFEPLSEADYIIQWSLGALGGILISYLVAEPLIALFRYILLPICIRKCSKSKPEPEELDPTKLDIKQLDADKEDKNIRNGYSHVGFDLFADLVENIF